MHGAALNLANEECVPNIYFIKIRVFCGGALFCFKFLSKAVLIASVLRYRLSVAIFPSKMSWVVRAPDWTYDAFLSPLLASEVSYCLYIFDCFLATAVGIQ